MCCIFTWLAWAFDATHRIVVFFMACLISSSVCCLLLTASLAGVAMGYNYSLAEYIDLKETNISVYIKRGVYDDEISDDFDWRRSAGGEPSLLHKDTGLRTGGTENQNALAPGRRRLADSVFESDDEQKYEGSLMRLTATPTVEPRRRFQPDPPYQTSPSSTTNLVDGLLAVADSLPGGSLQRLKAIQAAARHHEARKIELATAKIPEDASERQKVILENAQIHDARRNDPITTTDKYGKYFNQLKVHPGFPGSGLSARKFMESQQKDMETEPPNRFRDAVFRGQLAGWPTGASPKPTTENFFEYEMNFEPSAMPTAPTVQPLLVRPVGDNQPIRGLWEITKEPPRPILRKKPGDTEDKIYDDLSKSSSKSKIEDSRRKGQNDNDDDESLGLPSRKKRSNDQVSYGHNLYDGDILVRTNIHVSNEPVSVNNDSHLHVTNDVNESQSPHKTQSTDISQQTELENRNSRDNFINKNIQNTSLNDTISENKERRSPDQFIIKSLENVTSSDTMQEKVPSNLRKLKKIPESYDNRNEKTQTKPLWKEISVGAHKQWRTIISYLDKHITEFPNRNPKSIPSVRMEKKYKHTANSNQSTLLFKLVPTVNNKREDEDKIIDTKKTNITTN